MTINEMDDDTLCVCGHTLDYHHRWWLSGGGAFADECEFYGGDELGGMMQDDNGQWIEHCQEFQVKGVK